MILGYDDDQDDQVTVDAVVAMPCPWCVWSFFDGGAQGDMARITMAPPCDHLGDAAAARRWSVGGCEIGVLPGGQVRYRADVLLDAPAATMYLARPWRCSRHTMEWHAHILYAMDQHMCCLREWVVGVTVAGGTMDAGSAVASGRAK